MEKYRCDIGRRISFIRKEKLITQEKMAEEVGLSVKQYRMMEKGKYLPNIGVIDYAHNQGWDIDYILTGEKTDRSVFEKYIGNMSEFRRENVCNILMYEMGSELGLDKRTYQLRVEKENKRIMPIERIGAILGLDNENVTYADYAYVMGISEKTVGRIIHGKSQIEMEMVISVYRHCGVFPSYILYGEMNSHSECDRCYERANENGRKRMLKFVKLLHESSE